MSKKSVLLFLALVTAAARAFTIPSTVSLSTLTSTTASRKTIANLDNAQVTCLFSSLRPSSSTSEEDGPSLVDSWVETIQTSFRIAKESAAAGANFKQIVANVLAGDYDVEEVNAQLDELIASAPCVMFIWQVSPFSQKAIQALQVVAGAEVKIVKLDDPWDEGNPLRAELGKRTGRTSVPSVWIGGQYVGGFDGGVSEERPGLVDLAFRGTLRPKLEAAGALSKNN